jgi:hypothetical protein
MEREIMPDHAAEAFYRYLIPSNLLDGSEKPKKELTACVVFSKKVRLSFLESQAQEHEPADTHFI